MSSSSSVGLLLSGTSSRMLIYHFETRDGLRTHRAFADFLDEINLLIVPVVLGQGTRLFPDAGPDIALELVDSRADSKGVTLQVYRPTGRRFP
jgi:dihydrofolate reductase